jgi:YVTN family beta-propeller protein
MTPRQVGNYHLDHLLGVGGMGEVYHAYDSHRDRYVALKLLPEAFSGDQEYLRRFQRESHVAARLREPHVIPIHDFGEIDGRLFIDMRLVDGVDIHLLLDESGPIGPQRAVNLLSQVAQALDAAHADDLVHRDIKPSNILVTSSDFVYVVDFGIARAMGGQQTSLTITGATVGTLDYMAPERFIGHAVDGRADIYSLACVLYECLTATPPFDGKDLPSLMYAHLNSSPPQASSLVEGVPSALDAVIARGMAKDPADRFLTAGTLMAAAQEALLAKAPSPAEARSPAEAPRPGATVADKPAAVKPPAPKQDAMKPLGGEPASAGVHPTVSGPLIPPESLHLTSAGDPGNSLPPENTPPLENTPQSARSEPDDSRPPRDPAAGRPAREPNRRRRGMLILTGVVAVGIVVVLVLTFARPKTHGPTKVGNAAANSHAPITAKVAASAAVPKVATTIPVGKTPCYIQVAPNGKFAYIANQNADVITVLDTATDKISGIVNIPEGAPQFVSFSSDSRYAYVSVFNDDSYGDDSGTVHLIAFVDTATGAVTGTVQVNNEKPGPSMISPNGQYLYVPNHDMTMSFANGNKVDVINTSTKSLSDTIAVPMNPHWIVFGNGGQDFYTSDHMSGEVTVLSAHNNSIVKEIPVGETPHGEAMSPDGKRLAVTSYSGNFVSLIDTATNRVIAKIPTGKNPQTVAWAPDGRHLYTVNNQDNTVTVIDTADNKVTATIPAGKAPTSIAVLPNGRQAYVTNEGSGTIDVLDIAK